MSLTLKKREREKEKDVPCVPPHNFAPTQSCQADSGACALASERQVRGSGQIPERRNPQLRDESRESFELGPPV